MNKRPIRHDFWNGTIWNRSRVNIASNSLIIQKVIVQPREANFVSCMWFEIPVKHWGRFPFNQKTFENLETAANGTEISWKSFQKFRKLLNFRNANHSTENFRNSGSKVEWKENFREIFFENLGIPREVVLFFGMSENRHYRCSQPKNAVPFATGSCRKFKPEVLVEWKAPWNDALSMSFMQYQTLEFDKASNSSELIS